MIYLKIIIFLYINFTDSLYIVTIQQVELNQTDDENYQEKIKALTAMNNEKTMEIEKLKTQIKQYEGKIIDSIIMLTLFIS